MVIALINRIPDEIFQAFCLDLVDSVVPNQVFVPHQNALGFLCILEN